MARFDKSILCIGTVCQDIIIIVPEYPKEDYFTRLKSIKNNRGGNASTVAVVHSLLQRKINSKDPYKPVYYMGTLPTKEKSTFIINDFKKYANLNYDLCYFNDKNNGAISFVFNSLENGSRTIVHQQEKYELTFDEFCSQIHNRLENGTDLSATFDTIFFEFKWVKQMSKMIEYIKTNYNDKIKIAVEMETNRYKDKANWNDINELNKIVDRVILKADIVFFSQIYLMELGYSEENPMQFIKYFIDKYIERINTETCDKIVVIPWGSKGAYCLKLSDYDNVIFCKAYKPINGTVVDTLGAGDTFNGAFLFAFRQGWNLKKCCDFACRCAGYKVGFDGFDCIKNFNIVSAKL